MLTKQFAEACSAPAVVSVPGTCSSFSPQKEPIQAGTPIIDVLVHERLRLMRRCLPIILQASVAQVKICGTIGLGTTASSASAAGAALHKFSTAELGGPGAAHSVFVSVSCCCAHSDVQLFPQLSPWPYLAVLAVLCPTLRLGALRGFRAVWAKGFN